MRANAGGAWAVRAALLVLGPRLALADPVPEIPWQASPQTFLVEVPGVEDPTESLYPEHGNVGVATGASLRKDLADPSAGGAEWFLVELYDVQCPHCWYAVPAVTNLAAGFLGNLQLQIKTLNCHAEENSDTCFLLEYVADAEDYPTFLLCPPSERSAASVSDLPQKLQDLYPSLDSTRQDTILELSRCQRRFKKPPGVEMLSAGMIARWVTNETAVEPLHPDVFERGADFVERETVLLPDAPPGRPGWPDDRHNEPGVAAYRAESRWYDAIHGFLHLLYYSYRPHRHHATLSCTRFLVQAFPGGLSSAFGYLVSELERRGPSDNLTDFRTFLKMWAKDNTMPDPTKGIGNLLTCRTATCAIWSLLHVVVTAVSARGISSSPLLGDSDTVKIALRQGLIAPGDVMSFVRSSVEAFLSCRRCKLNFMSDFDECRYGRCSVGGDWRALSLWLWRVHNAVSLQVAMQVRPGVDRRWPMYQDCPTCWRRSVALAGRSLEERTMDVMATPAAASHTQVLDKAFHTNHVFWYLLRTYVGLHRVSIKLEDLPDKEEQEFEAATGIQPSERPTPPFDSAGGTHSDSNFGSRPADTTVPTTGLTVGQVEPHKPSGGEGNHHPLLFLTGLLLVIAGIGIIILSRDGSSQVRLLLQECEERPASAPMIRDPGEIALRSPEDDEHEDDAFAAE